MKLVTRRYAKIQNKWVRNRFVNSADRETPDIYALNATDISSWDQLVLDSAHKVIDSFLNDKNCEIKPLVRDLNKSTAQPKKLFKCEQCGKTLEGERQWQEHVTSRLHVKRSNYLKAVEERNAKREKRELEEKLIDSEVAEKSKLP